MKRYIKRVRRISHKINAHLIFEVNVSKKGIYPVHMEQIIIDVLHAVKTTRWPIFPLAKWNTWVYYILSTNMDTKS